jgi:hypothetical protein
MSLRDSPRWHLKLPRLYHNHFSQHLKPHGSSPGRWNIVSRTKPRRGAWVFGLKELTSLDNHLTEPVLNNEVQDCYSSLLVIAIAVRNLGRVWATRTRICSPTQEPDN